MRILLLTQWFQPEPMLKGLSFATALAARGHSVQVLTGFPNYPGGHLYPGYKIRPWQREVMAGIQINRVALYPSHDQSGLRRIVCYLTFAFSCLLIGIWRVHKPDVIYVYNLVTLGPAAFLLRLLCGAKVIIDVQDLWPESVINSGMLHNKVAHRLLETACTAIYRQADWVTVLSPGFKELLVSRGIEPEKIEVIYNWCDEATQKPAERDESLAVETGLAGRFNVMFAGTMGVMQGLDAVLKAAELCTTYTPNIQFVFIGGGIDRPRLEAMAAELNLPNVRFLPRQPPEMMGRYYALADALLVHLRDDPLFRITIPSKTQAYLYMGKPIIMAMTGDSASLVLQSGAGIVCPPDDPIALAEKVACLAAMKPEEREHMGQAGRNFYHQHLALQVGVDRFEHRMLALTGQAPNQSISTLSTFKLG